MSSDEPLYPWDHVNASRKNKRLQQKHFVDEAKARYLEEAAGCPSCLRPAGELAWFYFKNPSVTWATLCGREGWITVCDACNIQVEFFCEMMN